MADLAARVVARVNPRARVDRVAMTSGEPSTYASDNSTWLAACAGLGFTPMDLETQIDAVERGLGTESAYNTPEHGAGYGSLNAVGGET